MSRLRAILVAGLLATNCSVVYAQNCGGDKDCGDFPDTAPGFSGLPFDLLPPGARSLGLGGAFAGVADDATAAIANPAGLSNLSSAEVSVHFRNFDSDVDFVDVDAFDSGFWGDAGQFNKTYSDSGTDVSFASFVKPFDNWVVSAFYQNPLNFKSAQARPDLVSNLDFFDYYDNHNQVDSSITSYGLSLAYRITGNFSVGLTVQRSELELAMLDVWSVDNYFDYEYDFVEEDRAAAAAQIMDLYTASNSIGIGPGADEGDMDTTFSAGLLWNISEAFSLGLVYRQGAEYTVVNTAAVDYRIGCVGPDISDDYCAFLADEDRLYGFSTSEVNAITLKTPDTMTLGLAWRPSNTVLISLDVNHITYSDLTQVTSITKGFGWDVDSSEPLPGFSRGDFVSSEINGRTTPFTEAIKDKTTFHLGLEKVFLRPGQFMSSVTLRGGAYTVEDVDGSYDIDSSDTVFTVGLGAVLGGDARGRKQFQLDLGAAFGDNTQSIILSGIYRF